MENKIKELLSCKMYKELRRYLSFKEPEDIASALNGLSHEDMVLAFRLLPKEIASEVFVNLEYARLNVETSFIIAYRLTIKCYINTY